MKKYSGIPELVEQYMEESGTTARWVTVKELRSRFELTRYQGTTVSAFLRRLEQGPFVRFPYVVHKIERIPEDLPEKARGYRYMIVLRDGCPAQKRREQEMSGAMADQETIPAGL
ncbi:MAG: hypothetical protein WC342_02350 [Methanoregula sp.]|jgi:hypothetical protein